MTTTRHLAIALALGFGFTLSSCPTWAQPASSQASPTVDIEHTMLVRGQVQVDANGQVSGYQLDDVDSLPAGIKQMIAANVPQWQFAPVLENGVAVPASAHMHLRFVARQVDGNNLQVQLTAANFPRHEPSPQSKLPPFRHHLHQGELTRVLLQYKTNAVIYVAFRVNAQGEVADAVVRQVNLRQRGIPEQMNTIRAAYARVGLQAVRRMRLEPVNPELLNEDGYLEGILPINLCLPPCNRPEAGQWDAYVAGPRQSLPWREETRAEALAADAIPSDAGMRRDSHRLTLLTPLTGL